MNPQTAVLGQLIRDQQYAVDEEAVAEAMILRARARFAVPGVAFRGDTRDSQVRSFRRHRDARSFRLSPGAQRR